MTAYSFLFYLSLALGAYIVFRIYNASPALKYSSPIKGKLIFALRCAALLFLMLAFFDMRLDLLYHGKNYILLIDNSWSMKDNLSKSLKISTSMLEKLLSDENAVSQYVSFAARPAIEKNNVNISKLFFSQPRSETYNGATDLEAALEFGSALAGEGQSNKVLLFSDGVQTKGDYKNAVGRLRGAGIEVYPFVFDVSQNYDVMLTSINVAAVNTIGQKMEGKISLELKNADELDNVSLRIFSDNVLIFNRYVKLNRGYNTFKFYDEHKKVGYFKYVAFAEHPLDKNIHNNTMYGYTEVSGKPRILLVSSTQKTAQVASLFERLDCFLDCVEPSDFKSGVDELVRYKAIVLNDVSFNELKVSAVRSLKSYVADLGGGLMILGGDNSYGNGGYMMTPLEELSPFTMDVKDKAKLVSCAIIFIIDKSGSMSEMSSGFDNDRMLKIDLAKEAVIASIDLLLPKDRIGVMAFDDQYKWVSLPVSASQKSDVQQRVAELVAGGGTSMYGAIEEAFKEVKKENVTTRHLVALTDGITSRSDFDKLLSQFGESKVTLSAVALGRDADVPFLNTLAKKGGGRFYFSEDAASLPSIFVQETLKSSRNLIVEEIFNPKLVNSHPLFRSIPDAALMQLPILKGYVAASIKPNAELYLKAKNDDPLIATMQCGLGKTAGITFDFYGRWGNEFTRWEYFDLFLKNTMKYILRQDFSPNISWNVLRNGDELSLSIKTLGANREYINFLESELRISGPDNSYSTCEVVQSGVGIYSARVKLSKEGNYFFSLVQKGKNGELFQSVYGYCYPYSDEFSGSLKGRSTLEELAKATNGQIIDEKNFISALSKNSAGVKYKKTSIRNYLIAMAMLLFLIEIFLWRVDFSAETFLMIKTGILTAVAWICGNSKLFSSGSDARSAQVGKLMHIKDRFKKKDGENVDKSALTRDETAKNLSEAVTNGAENVRIKSGFDSNGQGGPSNVKNSPETGGDDEGGFTKRLLKIKRPKK